MSNKLKTPQHIVDEIIRQKLLGIKSRDIAEDLLGKKSAKSTVNDIYNKWLAGKVDSSHKVSDETKHKLKNNLAKVFTFDVETGMHLSYHFNLFGAYIKPEQIKEFPYMLTFAGKWLHEDKVYGHKLPDFPLWYVDKKSDYALIEKLWTYLNECDVAVAHNSRFDSGWFTQQCILHGFPPPSPYKLICTYKALKSCTSLPSKSLDYSTQYFRTLDEKLKNGGVSLWVRCMEGDESAFDEMLEYNLGDIPTAEQLYLKIRPWMKSHPNLALYVKSDVPICRVCQSTDLVPLETKAYTDVSIFETVQCQCCGKIQRKGTAINDKEHRSQQFRNVV